MDISNSLYYTFSTIAQVLAGFIALSGVFVIFKIQELKRMQFIQVQYFYNFISGISGLINSSFHSCPTIAIHIKTLHDSECIGGMEQEMNSIINDPNVQKSHEIKSLKKMKSIFERINSIRLRILFWTKISMTSGLLTIIFSIIVLTNVPNINTPQASFVIYMIGLMGFLFSILTMFLVILLCLKERNYIIDK